MNRRISLDCDPYCPNNYSAINQFFKREQAAIQNNIDESLLRVDFILAANKTPYFNITKGHCINSFLYLQHRLSKTLIMHKHRFGEL